MKDNLRCARQSDVSVLTTLLRRSWLRHWAPELPFSAVQVFASADPAAAYAAEMWPDFMLAEESGEVVGMCHVVDDLVAALHVDPARHGQGFGSALMDEAEARIAERFASGGLRYAP